MFNLEDCRFRHARLEDLAKVSQLEKRVWREMATSYQELRQRFLIFPQAFQLAMAQPPQVAGFCCGLLSDQDATGIDFDEQFPPDHVPRAKYFFLIGLTVNPVFRRKGVGATLVRGQIRVARRFRCRKIQLIANSNSQRLFEKHGFVPCRRLQLFDRFPALMPDPVLMELLL
ncbi:MAG: GNAT family N-acetyltransferase [Acidobacteriota bacterium]